MVAFSELDNLSLVGLAVPRFSRQVTSFSFLQVLLAEIEAHMSFYIPRLQGRSVIDIGNGTFSHEYVGKEYLSETGITDVVLVDPYNKPFDPKNPPFPITYARRDGLTFAKNRASGSANVFTCGLDCHILGEDPLSDEYCKRLVDEIYRILPEGGIYASCASEPLEYHANKRFSPDKTRKKLDVLTVFEK